MKLIVPLDDELNGNLLNHAMKTLGLNYLEMIPITSQAINELNAKIADL